MHTDRRPLLSSVALSTLTMLAPALFAAAPNTPDWSRFRGPNGQGTAQASNLPVRFGPEHNVVWKVDAPEGYSSPVLFEDRLYLTALHDEGLWTIAYDRGNGKELWRQRAPRARTEKLDPRNHPAAASPVVDSDVVVSFFGDYGLIAYDHRGKELWRKPLGPFNNLYGVGASPILVGDRLVLAVDQQTGSFMVALAKSSGEQLWRIDRPEAKTGHSTPALYRPEGGVDQLIMPGSFFLTSFSIEDGSKLWWVRGLSFEMKSVPVIDNGRLFINGFGSEFNEPGKSAKIGDWEVVLADADANGDGRLARDEMPDELSKNWFPYNDLDGDGTMTADEWSYFRSAMATRNNIMAVRLPGAGVRGDLTESNILWQYFRSVPQLPSPVMLASVLYMVNDRGIVTSFKPDSGEVIAQGRIDGAADSYYACPVAADGKVYFSSRSGSVSVLPPGGALDPLQVNDLEEQILATPAIADGRLYIRTKSKLYAFGSVDG